MMCKTGLLLTRHLNPPMPHLLGNIQQVRVIDPAITLTEELGHLRHPILVHDELGIEDHLSPFAEGEEQIHAEAVVIGVDAVAHLRRPIAQRFL